MIGDHQQLRPSYTDYNLVRMHHIDVSLFERLIRNGMCYQQLENQHPHEEEEDDFDESLSQSNTYEADFISKLYRHLRLQGYFQHEITVLSFYKDQVQLLRKKIREIEQTDEFLMNISPEWCTDGTLFPGDIRA
ncbi:hypothetical protein ACJMK2_012508 [Sinanodonta woodiana]|uniref:DNA2/NAM7 helicase-like C-terminal domain-containing protein n=1 Tax=Sinanodonta woodiana TaxID=1069815 RepID=A0ABD3V8E5_SINWO